MDQLKQELKIVALQCLCAIVIAGMLCFSFIFAKTQDHDVQLHKLHITQTNIDWNLECMKRAKTSSDVDECWASAYNNADRTAG